MIKQQYKQVNQGYQLELMFEKSASLMLSEGKKNNLALDHDYYRANIRPSLDINNKDY